MTHYCSNCGTKSIDNTAKFCHSCGHAYKLPQSNNVRATFEGDVNNSEVFVAGGDININDKTECLDCFGTGIEHEECPDCKGTGKITYYNGPKNNLKTDNLLVGLLYTMKESYEQWEPSNYDKRDCYKCLGKGRLIAGNPQNSLKAFQEVRNTGISTKKCPTCKGFGEVRL